MSELKVVEVILELLGVALLIIGYRKNRRNVLLAGALILWIGGGISDIVRGAMDGYKDGVRARSQAEEESHH